MKKRPKEGATRQASESPNPSSGWLAWRKLAVLGGVVFLVVLLPSIAAKTPLLGWGVAQATADLQGKVTVGSASLGWFSPVVLHNVKVVDAAGEAVADIPTLRVSKSLLGLLQNGNNLGTIEIQRPVLHLTARAGTTNWEELLPIEEPKEEEADDDSASDSSPTLVRWIVRQGTIHLADATTSRQWTIEDFSAELDWRTPDHCPPCSFAATIRQGQHVGAIQGKGHLPLGTNDARFSVVARNLPLGLGEWVATRLRQEFLVTGELNGQVDWAQAAGVPSLICNLEAGGIHVRQRDDSRGTGWNNGMLRATGEITLTGTQVLAKQFTVTTDWGQVLAHGNVPASLATATSPNASEVSLLGDQPWEVRGTIDLARLTSAFPQWLMIREGVQLHEGRVSLNVANAPKAGRPLLQGSAQLSKIVATVGGRQDEWQQPLELAFALSQTDGKLQLDRVQCQSSFLTANGQTQGNRTQVDFQLDGSALITDLARFVDLQGTELAGMLQGSLQLQNLGEGRLAVGATIEATDTLWAHEGQVYLSEPELNGQLQSSLVWQTGAIQQIESATVVLKTQQTSLTLQTADRVVLGSSPQWPLKLQLQGPMEPVWSQLRHATPFSEYELEGNGYLLAKVTLGADRWDLQGVNLDVNQFALTGPLTQIQEPKLKLEGNASIDWQAEHFASSQLVIVGTTLSARATDIGIPLTARGTASGTLAYRVDLKRGVHWVIPPDYLGEKRVAGEMSGSMSLAKSDSGVVLQNSGQIKNWELIVPREDSKPAGQTQAVSSTNPSLTWAEPNLAYSQSITYNGAEDTLALHGFQLQSGGLQISAQGGVSQLSTVGNVSINGQVSYDWNRIAPLLAAVMGPEITIGGQRTSRFQWTGPMWGGDGSTAAVVTLSPQWEANADVSWKEAQIYGLPVGETTVSAELRQGVLHLLATSPELSGGQLDLRSQLMFNAIPVQWQLPRGRVIDNVAITPLMCRGWLQYVAPILADATRVEGRFSLDVETGRFPLEDPMAGEASGVLSIHGAEVRSGPMAHGYVMLARNIEALVKAKPPTAIDQGSATLLTLPPQQIPYRMVRHRVYHEGLTVQSGDVRIVTSGWVDSEQKMQLVAQVPVQDNWIQRAPWLAPLRGTALTVPIGGTVHNPKLDTQSLDQMARTMIDNAARGALQEGINRGLQELFRPR